MLKRKAAASLNLVQKRKDGDGKARKKADDDINSDAEAAPEVPEEDDFFEEETADEKRLRLTHEFLTQIDGADGADGLESQLQRDQDIKENRVTFEIADKLSLASSTFYKGHMRPTTCVAITNDERTAFTGGKDCAILKWDLETGAKTVLPGKRGEFDCGGHFEAVMGVALSQDDRMLISVGHDRLVRLWDLRDPRKCVDSFRGHSAPITGVVAEPGGDLVYTASEDKTVKVWNLSSRCYMDTLFGHCAGITSLDMFNKDRLLTGSMDKSARNWKVAADTHLLFAHHSASVDAVAAVHSDRFVTGSEDGQMMLWSSNSKKPQATVAAHGGAWVSAVAAIRQSDVVLSGSQTGAVKVWKTATGEALGKKKGKLSFQSLLDIPVVGAVNAIKTSSSGKLAVVAVGREGRNGRWETVPQAKNGIQVVRFDW